MQCIIRSRNDRKIRTYLLYILKSCCKYAEGLKERTEHTNGNIKDK